ncbi:prolipoprotein diacylglyceryl transferase [Salinactinospora qingdaonensis]|uniref:Phosphatidylglycerol--prolipoprotein diacylglyceryl transferase n=1 Tax=Salinactinospora qingdaonensis TaxID=702744 RepID=A0ABP7FML3_9ACTN
MTTVSITETGAAGTGRALAAIPSPDISSISLGPLTIHFYALCILAGVVVAVYWSDRRWVALGGEKGTILDLAVPAVLFGLIGGRLYHVISDYQIYFDPDTPPNKEPIQALFIWEGGLGIWGAIPLGALGVWLVARRRGLSMSQLSFAIAPALPLAQAIGRWGNYFNQELFGRPTDLPWALEVSPYPNGILRPGMEPGEFTYHPTFLYESLWCVGLAVLLAWAGKRFDMRGGRLLALYVMGYCVGRFWIEYLRVDPANEILGLRLNNWTSLVVFLAALAYFLWAGRNLDRFSTQVVPTGHTQQGDVAAGTDDPSTESAAMTAESDHESETSAQTNANGADTTGRPQREE